jgi:ELWxxDGT repeat protein
MKQFLQAILFVLISFSAVSQNPLPVTNVQSSCPFPFCGNGGPGIYIGSEGGAVQNRGVATVGNIIYFIGVESEHGSALWKYNTTTREYSLIKDVYPDGGFIGDIIALGNNVYFMGGDGVPGNNNAKDIYMSDGTAAGTVLLFTKTDQESFNGFLKAGNFIYFGTSNQQAQTNIYSISGSTVTLLKQITQAPGTGFSIYQTASYGGYFFFMGYDDAHGTELWRSDGTPGGTGLYANLGVEYQGTAYGSYCSEFTEVNNQLLFKAGYSVFDAQSNAVVGRNALMKMTSPSSAPVPFYGYSSNDDLNLLSASFINGYGFENQQPVLNGVFYFNGFTTNEGSELWRTDLTKDGTYMVKDFYSGQDGLSPNLITKFNDKIIFVGSEPNGGGQSLWQTDGTANGTVKIGGDKIANNMTNGMGKVIIRGNRLYTLGWYNGSPAGIGTGIWSTDGTNEGTVMVSPPCFILGPANTTENIGDSIYFSTTSIDASCASELTYQLYKFTIPTKLWLGKVSTDWNNPGNWDPVGVPSNTNDVLIPGDITNYPVVAANAVARNLWINWGSVNVASGVQLTVNGELSVIGNLTGDGSLVMAAAGNDNLHGQGAIDIASVIINGSDVTLKGNKEFKKAEFLSNNKIFLEDNNLVITDNTSPVSGYNANRYFVTNGTGALTLKDVGTTPAVFPVGCSPASYNPLTISNNGEPDNFSVRVTPGVYDNGNSGTAISNNVVNRTWFVNEGSVGSSDVTLTAQWNAIDELTGFNRSAIFISHYINDAWDGTAGSVASGNDPFTSSRSGFTIFSPFTVFSQAAIDSDNDGTPDNQDCAPDDNTKWRSVLLYIDTDGDGYNAGTATICYGTIVPAGYSLVTSGTDCDDSDQAKHTSFNFYADTDADGFGSGNAVSLCAIDANTPPAGYSINNTDNCPNTSNPDQLDSDQNGIGDVCDNTINITSSLPPLTCQSSSFSVNYIATGTFNIGNIFTVQLSNSAGNFVSPISIGTLNSTSSGTIPCNLTYDLAVPAGTGYRVRIISSPPAVISPENGSNMEIRVNTFYYRDADGDGYGDEGNKIEVCFPVSGYVLNNTDCNDNNAAIHSGAVEICNGIDDNCNGQIDEGVQTTFYQDADGDGYGSGIGVLACTQPTGYVTNNTDNCAFIYNSDQSDTNNDGIGDVCDNSITINSTLFPFTCPGASFGIFYIATGVFNSGNIFTAQSSNSSGSFASPVNIGSVTASSSGSISCILPVNLPAGIGYRIRIISSEPAVISPDNGSDLEIRVMVTYYRDADGDGFGTTGYSLQNCFPIPGFVIDNTDCNDNNAAIHPGAVEICNGIDDNCNGQIDEGVKETYYLDADGDSYGDPLVTTLACTTPSGYVANNTDCNDGDASIYPGAPELCDGKDNNCNGTSDEGVKTTFYRDADGDGYGNNAVTTQACSAPSGYVNDNTDCNDANAAVHPGATETCNGIDDNCDGQEDEGCPISPIISINDVTVYESQGVATLTVRLLKTSTQAININYTTINGTAISKGKGKNPVIDFIAAKSTLTIPAGSLTGTISITIVNNGLTEPTEYFNVQLSITNKVNATISDGSGRVTILDGVAPTITSTRTTNTVAGTNSQLKAPVETETFFVNVAPNPSTGNFRLKIQSSGFEKLGIRITDIAGRLVKVMVLGGGNQNILLGNELKQGIYLVEVRQGKKRETLKLIKLE